MNSSSARLKNGIENLAATGQFRQILTICKQTLPAARREKDPVAEAISMYGVASAYRHLGKFKEARAFADGALEVGKLGPELVSMALLERGAIQLTGYFQVYEARDDYRDALANASMIEDRAGIAAALIGLANVFHHLEETQQGINYAREALDIAHELKHNRLQVQALTILGSLDIQQQEYERALSSYTLGLNLCKRAEPTYLALGAFIAYHIGRLQVRIGRTADALDELNQAAEVAQQLEYAYLLLISLEQRGEAHQLLGDYAAAREQFDTIIRLSDRIEAPLYAAIGELSLGRLHLEQSEAAIAADYFQQAAARAHQHLNPQFESLALQHLADAQFHQAEYALAADALRNALDIELSLDNVRMVRSLLPRLVWIQLRRLVASLLRFFGLKPES